MTTDNDMLKDQVLNIVDTINNGAEYEYCPDCGCDKFANDECCDTFKGRVMDAIDYLSDTLEITDIICEDTGDYLGAKILVAFGGPNIWINTQTKTVDGFWWGEEYQGRYVNDEMDIGNICKMFWECK